MQLRRPEKVGDGFPRSPAPGLHNNPPILTRHRMPEIAARRTPPRLRRPDERIHRLRRHHRRRHALGHRHIQMLPLPGVALHEQRHRRRRRPIQPPLILRLKPAMLQRLPILPPADAHNQPHRIADDFLPGIPAIRPRLPERGNGRHNQSGVDRLQRIITQPQPRQVAGAVAFHHHIHMRDQLPEKLPPRLGGQIQRRPFLIQIKRQEKQTLFRVRIIPGKGRHPPQRRPRRRLQLQRLRPVIRQQTGAKRPGDILAQIQNLHPLQRPMPQRRRKPGGSIGQQKSPPT